MAASDHLSPGQFYHGTRSEFAPGDVLTPGAAAEHANFGETDHDYVHVADTPGKAYKFAGIADTFAAQRRGVTNTAPKVYKVEPVGSVEPDEEFDDEDVKLGNSYRSSAGFRVVDRHW